MAMNHEMFREKAERQYRVDMPRGYAFGGPFVCPEPRTNLAFYTIVRWEEGFFRETVYVVWPSENGNLQQGEIVNLTGFFKTSLSVRLENSHALLNVYCEEDEGVVRELGFRIPLYIIGEWCRKERPDKEVIIN